MTVIFLAIEKLILKGEITQRMDSTETITDVYENLSPTQMTMIAGGIAGSVAKTVTAPLSRLTILYQVSPMLHAQLMGTGKTHEYQSLSRMCRKIAAEEGFMAFWKGNLTSVLHRFPYSAINFTAYEWAREILGEKLKLQESMPTRFACGAFAGGVACVMCYPLDLIRTRLTVDSTPMLRSLGGGTDNVKIRPRYSLGITETFNKIYQQEGIRGLYRGLFISLAVSVPNLALGFSVYGTLKECLLTMKSPYFTSPCQSQRPGCASDEVVLNAAGSLISGAASGILSSLIIFPADVVRRRMQIAGMLGKGALNTSLGSSVSYEGLNAFALFRTILRSQGLVGLYTGILPELLKVTPMVAVTFSTYELTLKALKSSKLD